MKFFVKISLSTLLTVIVNISVAQSPGNVSSNLSIWLKADAGAEELASDAAEDGDALLNWLDQSSSSNDVTQSTGTDQPIWRNSGADLINFNPIVEFDGTNDDMQDANGILGGSSYTDLNVYFVARTNTVQNSMIFQESTTSDRISAHVPWSDAVYYWDAGNTLSTQRISGAWGGTAGEPYLWSNLFSTTSGQTISSTRQSFSRDGLTVASDNTGSSFTGNNGSFNIGSNSGTSTWMHADIAEFIAYTGSISAAQHNQIESYLSLKYGATLSNSGGGTDGDYVSSSGSTIWDASANSTYHNDVFGLSRDDNSGLDQRVSASKNSDGVLILANDNDFTNANNNGSRTSLDNSEFAIVGNNNGAASWTTTGAPSGFELLNRVWKIEETGTIGTIYFQFDVGDSDFDLPALRSGTNYYLVADTDGDASLADETPFALTNSSGNLWTSSLDFSDGAIFTLVSETVGTPGGISATLMVWLDATSGTEEAASDDAEDGDAMLNWLDKSVAGNDVTQSTASNKPIWRNSGADLVNYNPIVEFDGSNDYMADATGVMGASTFNDLNVYYIGRTNTVQDSWLFREVTNIDKYSVHLPWSDNNVYWDTGYNYGDYRLSGAWGGTTGQAYLWDFLYSTTSGQTLSATKQAIIRDGQVIHSDNTATANTGDNNAFSVGGRGDGTQSMHADIAELILIADPVSSTDHNKIESYMALKYGITIDNTDGGTDGDYIDSDATTIWDASDGSSFHNDVIGIGRDNSSGLLQKQSTSPDDSVKIYVGTLAASNSANSGTITNNNSFVVIGHNDGINNGDVTEKPAGIYSKLGREWKITNTNFSDSYTIVFEWKEEGAFDINDIRFLVDSDGDFSDATILSSSDGLTFTEGSVIISGITTSMIPMNSTKYITFASASSATPLPVELLSFEVYAEERKAVLNWITASEVNNDFFIIQNSTDAVSWHDLDSTNGRGTTNEYSSYKYIHTDPVDGINYYRLKQVDYDGTYSYSDLKFIELTPKPKLNLFPNPINSNQTVTFTSSPNFDGEIKIYNSVGSCVRIISGQNELLIDLIPGIYFVEFDNEVQKLLIHD